MADFQHKFNQALRRKAREDRAQQGNEPIRDSESREQATTTLRRTNVDAPEDNSEPAPKRLKSPPTSIGEHVREPENPPPAPAPPEDFPSRPPIKSKGRLWTEGDPALPRSATTQQEQHATPRPSRRNHANRSAGGGGGGGSNNGPVTEEEDASVTVMIKQPETRPISQDQLVAEVKGIYAGLVMVESKCIEVDSQQSSQTDATAKLNNEQWQALIALHRTLLHEHHDFFLASQHPSASPALRRLASKYAMPARMWRHGIHSFLELLRHRLPTSLEHMLTFIYLAYSMMALLYETVPAFEDTWIECLGDLARYRMAIEDEDIRDREIWTAVSRHWYSKASDKAPTTGRLHHHLAILARPNAIQQLFYYTKSLCVGIPFKSARDSILTLFDPILAGTQTRLQAIDLAYVKAHGILFIISNTDEKEKALPKPVDDLMFEYETAKNDFFSLLDNHIARTTRSWMEPGAFIAISNSNSLLEYGKTEANKQGGANPIIMAIQPQVEGDTQMENSTDNTNPPTSKIFGVASELAKKCDSVVFKRYGDNNILPYLNVRLSYMNFMAARPAAMKYIESTFPWTLAALILNSLSDGFQYHHRIESKEFPCPSDRPLPEDWSLRGLLWTDTLFPQTWFSSEKVDEDEKTFELPSMTEYRRERVLWLGWNIALHGKWLVYDQETKQFTATPEFQTEEQDDRSENTTLAENDDIISRTSTFDSRTTIMDGSTKTWTYDKGGGPTSEPDDGESMVVEKGE